MITNIENLLVGDRRFHEGRIWVVHAAEMQEGLMQIIWRSGEETRWDESPPNAPVLIMEREPAKSTVRQITNAAALAIGDRRVGVSQPPYAVRSIEHTTNNVVVEWSNGSRTRVLEHDPLEGIPIERVLPDR